MAPKRKSDAAVTIAAKKARLDGDLAAGRKLVEDVLSAATPSSVEQVQDLAKYARLLEEELAKYKPKEKSAEEVEDAADTLRGVITRGMTKLMKWTPSCKTRSAKLSYDGVCTDPTVFGAALGLSGPPRWKMHKYTVEEFQKAIGTTIEGSVRYDSLYLYDNVNVRYNPQDGTYKFTGTYGKPA